MNIDPSTFLTPAAVLLIIGLTQLVKSLTTKPGEASPRWLIAVPSCLGLIAGTVRTLAEPFPAGTATVQMAAITIETALGYAGAAMLLFEIYSRTLGAKAAERKAAQEPK